MASTRSAIGAPVLQRTTFHSLDSVTLDWEDNSDNENHFNIQRSLSSSFDDHIEFRLPANTVAFVDQGLEPNATYYYRIYASNDFGTTSEFSNQMDVFTTAALEEILGLTEEENFLYPNPSKDGRFRLRGSKDVDIEVFDMNGRSVDYRRRQEGEHIVLFIKPKGTFLLRVEENDNRYRVLKVVVE